MRAQNSDASITLLLDYKRAAQALCFTEQALRDLVAKGRGPAVTKIGRRRMFALADLQAFVERHRAPQVLPVTLRTPSSLVVGSDGRHGRASVS